MRRRGLCVAVILAMAAGPAWAVDAPQPTTADLARARAMVKAKDFKGALAELRQYEGRLEHADLYNLLGFAYRKTGDHARAEVNYAKALSLDPNHLGALEYQGELFIETNRIERARQNLARLATLCPRGCEELDDLREALRAKGG
jgi:Flp pilus assembly protein TadD